MPFRCGSHGECYWKEEGAVGEGLGTGRSSRRGQTPSGLLTRCLGKVKRLGRAQGFQYGEVRMKINKAEAKGSGERSERRGGYWR